MKQVLYTTVTENRVIEFHGGRPFPEWAVGRTCKITLEVKRGKRTLEQNAYWWGVVVKTLAEEFGYDHHDHDSLHYALVEECFGFRRLNGLRVPVKTGSSKLTIGEFSQLIDWAIRWAAMEHGIVIPTPDEQ